MVLELMKLNIFPNFSVTFMVSFTIASTMKSTGESSTCHLISGADFDRITPRNIKKMRSLSFQTGRYWLPPMFPNLKILNYIRMRMEQLKSRIPFIYIP